MSADKERMEILLGVNMFKDPITVRHSELERASTESNYRSICPICKTGLLMVYRDSKTLELRADDNCMLCGQHFIYEDIQEMRDRLH